MRKQTLNRLQNKARLTYARRVQVWEAILRRLETEQATCGILRDISNGAYCILGILQESLFDAGLGRKQFIRAAPSQPRPTQPFSALIPDWDRLSKDEATAISGIVEGKCSYPFVLLLPAIGLGHWGSSTVFQQHDVSLYEIGDWPVKAPLEVLPIWKRLHEEVTALIEADKVGPWDKRNDLNCHVYKGMEILQEAFYDIAAGGLPSEIADPFLPTPFDKQPWAA